MSGCDIYTLCYILEGKTGNITTFAQFEERDILTKTRNDAETSYESDDDSIIPSLLVEEEIDVMDSGDELDHDLISTEMSEDIRDGSQSHTNVNQRES